jgi:hypothetical protein
MEMTEQSREIITVIDPRHPLYGQSLRFLGITTKNRLGRCCMVLDHYGHERNIPLGVTDQSPDPVVIAPSPLSVATITSLVRVYSHICPQPGTDREVGEEDGREIPHESRTQAAQLSAKEPTGERALKRSSHSKLTDVGWPFGTPATDGGDNRDQNLPSSGTLLSSTDCK